MYFASQRRFTSASRGLSPTVLVQRSSSSLSFFRLPCGVGGQEDPRHPSGRRMHQWYHPRDQRCVSQGQRRPGDGRRVASHPCAPSNHDTDSQVAPVKILITASHRLASAAGASIGILLGGRLRSSSSGDEDDDNDDDDAVRQGTAGRHGRSSRSIGLSERTFIVLGGGGGEKE